MDIPEQVQELIEQMGQVLIQTLSEDPASRRLAQEIQTHGFDVAVILEATIALHRREARAAETETAPFEVRLESPEAGPWSEEDKAFLRRFKISLD